MTPVWQANICADGLTAMMEDGCMLLVRRQARGQGWWWELDACDPDDDCAGAAPDLNEAQCRAVSAYMQWRVDR